VTSASITNRPEDVANVAISIQEKLESSIHTINDVYERTHVLSINSRIEAARVGEKGKGFKIVAQEFSQLNNEIANIANELQEKIRGELQTLKLISEAMAKDVRGQRLALIGTSVMDVIDRNLYERSCDVRWWATDDSVFSVLSNPDQETTRFASQRLATILESYTVYLDIVVADIDGKIVANGRPEKYSSRDTTVQQTLWFRRAKELRNAQEYTLESTHRDSLVKNNLVLVYSSLIFNPRELNQRPIGVLGVLFDWESLFRAVFGRLTKQDLKNDIEKNKIPTEIWIIDENGSVLASLERDQEGAQAPIEGLQSIISSHKQDYKITRTDKATEIVAWGYSPGFETYKSGWYCVLRQKIDL